MKTQASFLAKTLFKVARNTQSHQHSEPQQKDTEKGPSNTLQLGVEATLKEV